MATMCMTNDILAVQESSIELPPGFRFHPTDEELVSYYLTRKINNTNFSVKAIVEVDLNKCEPWDLPEKASVGEKEWYFFSLRDRKYPTGNRTNRATEKGYWKATGKDRDVMNSRSHILVGMKKTLVFYRGRAPKGEKTNWIMHEYRIESDSTNHLNQQPLRSKDEWVVCRVFQKSAGSKKSFLYADMRHPNYQYHDSHSSLPGHFDHSPNPTVSDEGDCDTVNDSCYNCQDQLQDSAGLTQRELPWVIRTKLGANAPVSVPMSTPGMDINNLMKYPFYDPNPNPNPHSNLNMLRFSTLPQSMVHSGLASMKSFDQESMRMRPKMEPYNTCEGEDEAQSNQRGGMDYAWAGENVLYQDIPCEGPMIPIQSLTAGTDQSSCITESFCEEQQAGLFSRLRGYNGLPEMPGAMDSLQECMWAY